MQACCKRVLEHPLEFSTTFWAWCAQHLGSPKLGVRFAGPYNKDYDILSSSYLRTLRKPAHEPCQQLGETTFLG